MGKLSFLSVTFFSFVLQSALYGATVLNLEKTQNKVEFLAVGTPSAIKIRGKQGGDTKGLKGALTVEGTKVSGKANIRLDDFDTGIDTRNKHMKEKYLETAKYPEAEFVFTSMEIPVLMAAMSKKEIPFKGTLTLHGVTKPVEGIAQLEKKGEEIQLGFAFKFPLSQFGIDTPSFAGIKVSEDVSVNVEIAGKAS